VLNGRSAGKTTSTKRGIALALSCVPDPAGEGVEKVGEGERRQLTAFRHDLLQPPEERSGREKPAR
jgi:hypothetical protein